MTKATYKSNSLFPLSFRRKVHNGGTKAAGGRKLRDDVFYLAKSKGEQNIEQGYKLLKATPSDVLSPASLYFLTPPPTPNSLISQGTNVQICELLGKISYSEY